MRPSVFVLVCLLLAGASGVARAQHDLPGVRAMSQGEAMRASATGAAGPLLNPAGMSLLRQYTIEVNYGLNIEQLGHNLHASIVDSITSRVAAALFYNYIHASPKVGFDWAGGRVDSTKLTRDGHAAGLALSLPLGDHFILGATAKYLHFDTTAPLPAGAVPKKLSLDSVNGVTFDVGLLLKLGDKFRIAVVGQNLWDHGSYESPLLLAFGVGVTPVAQLTINFDAVVNFTGFENYKIDDTTGEISKDSRITGRLGPGLEWLIANKVPLRAGLIYDTGYSATYLTAGLGYVSTSFGVDLGYRGKVSGGLENVLMLGLRIFVD